MKQLLFGFLLIYFLTPPALSWAVCGIPWAGDWTNSGSCTIPPGTIDGVDNGNAYLPAGSSLVINGTFVYSPGTGSVRPTFPGQITFGSGGKMMRTLAWYTDVDQDRYINASGPIYLQSTQPSGTTRKKDVLGIDCNDNNAAVNAGSMQTYYRDADGDGYGNPAIHQLLCSAIPGWVLDNTDCNDSNPAIHGGSSVYGYVDNDGDGHGDPSFGQTFCGVLPPGYVSDGDDCCDSDGSVFPGQSGYFTSPTSSCNVGWDYNCSNGTEKESESYPTTCITVVLGGCSIFGGDSHCSEDTSATPNCGESYTTGGTGCSGSPISCPPGTSGSSTCVYGAPGTTSTLGCH